LKPQKTIKNEAKISGKGLFTGKDAKIVFKPAELDTGIVFIRTDIDETVRISAVATNVSKQDRRTSIQKGSITIDTVEHCLAAVSALEIDNLIVEVTGPEMPAPDCSSAEYFRVLQKAQPTEQQGSRKEFVIRQSISIASADASIYALPYPDDALNITYDLDYTGHTGINRQLFSCRVTPEGFEKNLAPARTFLLEAEAKQFQAKGIGKHLGPKDLLVINSDGPIKNSYRFPNECARHKIVDLIGDIALIGRPVKGRIVAYKSGHDLNQQLAERLYKAAVQADRIQQFGTDAILDIRRIQKILPHRYPFLLVDKVTEVESDVKITGIKNVTFNEQFFQGHFPGTPIMPGVLIIEAMAQISGLLFSQKLEHTGKLALLLSMDNVKLRKTVVPGDQLVLTAEVVRIRKRTAQCQCKAMVGDSIAAEAQIRFMLVDDETI
jgi:UDP-3-O-[3-hydroxymyristoyl] N-acetylglucosamine deacetylase/3-hydroxyacyl-[acyl-carrier-protein] dehydratase